MKRLWSYLLFLPLLISCGEMPKITYEQALEHLDKIETKYKDLNNVERDFEMQETKRDNGNVISTYTYAYDCESKIHYSVSKIGNKTYITYSYFEAHGDNFDLISLINDGANKIKHRKPATGLVGEEYFKAQFQTEIQSYINLTKSAFDLAKKDGTYRARHDDDLHFSFANQEDSYRIEINRGRFTRYYHRTIDNSHRMEQTNTFSYERFAVSVNPDEYIEQ